MKVKHIEDSTLPGYYWVGVAYKSYSALKREPDSEPELMIIEVKTDGYFYVCGSDEELNDHHVSQVNFVCAIKEPDIS